MPGPYPFSLNPDSQGFEYETGDPANPTAYMAPGTEVVVSACELLNLINAGTLANGNNGVDANDENFNLQDFMAGLERECIDNPIRLIPPAGQVQEAYERDPAPYGGDSWQRQGAPVPPVFGSIPQGQEPPEFFPPTEEPLRPAPGEPNPYFAGEQPSQQTNTADPVDIFSGAFYLEETDLVIPNTLLPMVFTRYYRSGIASFGPFGWNWDHNFNLYLRELNTGDVALWRNLHEDIFKFNGENFDPPRGVFEMLTNTGTHAFEVSATGGTVMRFARPSGYTDAERIPIIWLQDRHGNRLHFTYGDENKLAMVRDDDGRYFAFGYDACGLMTAVTDQSGRSFVYEHDEETMQLTSATSPAIAGLPNGVSRAYDYEKPWTNPELRHNIVRIADHAGNIYLENTYEQDPAIVSYARLTTQLHGGYLYQFQYTQLQWVPADPAYINIPAWRTEVMNPDYGLETYTFNYRGDLLDRRYRLSVDRSYRIVAWQYEFDSQGNQAKLISPDGSTEISIYDDAHPDPRMRDKLLRREFTAASGFPSPSRIVWQARYNEQFQLISEERNESGALTIYKYDFDVMPASTTNTGKLIEIIHPDATLPDGTLQSTHTLFEYNPKGQVIATITPDGMRKESLYGEDGNEKNRVIKEVSDPTGLHVAIEYRYDDAGHMKEKIDANGNMYSHTYNAFGLLERESASAVDGVRAETFHYYDGDRKCIVTKNPKGAYAELLTDTDTHIRNDYHRNAMGHIVKYTLASNTPEPTTTEVRQNYKGQPIETRHPDGSILKILYDERGLTLSETLLGRDGQTITSSKAYNRMGKVTQETNAFGGISRYEYDGFSRPTKITLPNGTEIIRSWLANDLVGAETVYGDDGNGHRAMLSYKSCRYDEKDRIVSETIHSFSDPAEMVALTTTYFYDPMDRVVKTINHRGGIALKTYDMLGRLAVETDAAGNEEHYFYDNNDNIVKTESHHMEPDGSLSVIAKIFEYDARNRRISMIENDGTRTVSRYDDRNLLTSQTDQLGISTQFTYNAFGKKTGEVHDPGQLNIVKSWTLDQMSRVTAFTDPSGEVSTYEYDSVGRIIKTSFPNGYINSKSYNARNQLTGETFASGASFSFGYDMANRLVRIENTYAPTPLHPVGLQEFTFDGLDRVVVATSGDHSIRRKFDSQKRLLEETAGGVTLKCAYNDAEGTITKQWPDGRSETGKHDLCGVLSAIEETTGGTIGAGKREIVSFKPSGRQCVGETYYPESVMVTNRYDDRKRNVSIECSSPSGLDWRVRYLYDGSNMRVVEGFQGSNEKTFLFGYDSQHRLVNAKSGFSASLPLAMDQAQHDAGIEAAKAAAVTASDLETFAYDLSDCRVHHQESGKPDKHYEYIPGHRIASVNGDAFSYQPDGMLKSDGNLDYEADASGRIIRVKSGSNVLTAITYDAFNRPIEIMESGKPVRTLYYLGSACLQENAEGTLAKHITRSPGTGLPLAYHLSGKTVYPLFDVRHTLRALLDDTGAIVESYQYMPFGLPKIFDVSGALISESAYGVDVIFGGQSFLFSCGLYRSVKRLMDPNNGTFLSADPEGYTDSSSLYIANKQNPINFIDPKGSLFWLIPVFVIGGELIGIGLVAKDAYENPEEYQGDEGFYKVLGAAWGGAAAGALTLYGGEAILAVGGAPSMFTAGTTATMTTTEMFVTYATASSVGGALGRGMMHEVVPNQVDPVSGETIATDYVMGGGIPVLGQGLVKIAGPFVSPLTQRMGGNWRAFGNTRDLLLNPKVKYSWRNLFYDDRTFGAVSKQYWRPSRGANGMSLQHLWFQNQSRWVPRGVRNAGFNLMEIPKGLNSWMGGRLPRELGFRAAVTGAAASVGYGANRATAYLIQTEEPEHPNTGTSK